MPWGREARSEIPSILPPCEELPGWSGFLLQWIVVIEICQGIPYTFSNKPRQDTTPAERSYIEQVNEVCPITERTNQSFLLSIFSWLGVTSVFGGGWAMNADELRSVQAPLKDRYRRTPDAARVTLKAQGRLDEGVTCKLETGKALVVAGLHPATGGTGQSACSGEMLLEALVACAGVTLNAVASALGIGLRNGSIQAEGDLDFRGTLGVSKDVPVGFQDIRLTFMLDTDASDEQLATLLRLTERYCVVYQTLVRPPAMTISRQRGGA